MVVAGSTTVGLATQSWVPPFSPVTSTEISYIGGPTTTAAASTSSTGVAATGTSSAGPVDPTVPPRANDHDYVDIYLKIHSLSTSSYRYAYFLWFVLIFLFAVYAVAHQMGLRGGFFGSLWTKYSIRRRVLKSRKRKSHLGSRNTVLPSNAQIISIVLVGVISALVCVIGNDYINPYSNVWDVGSSFAKRAAATVYQTPSYNISKTWWTSGARFGLIAFALFPLVILLALKAPPFAVLALRGLTQIHSDKLALLHRWTGRIIWLVTTIHVVLWTVQLFINERGNGENRKMWFVIWIYDKFIWAVVAYIGMTGLIALSFKPIRRRAYETFYVLHIVLTIITLLGSALHYPPTWYWIGGAALLWVVERIYRFIRLGWINGWFGGMNRQIDLVAGPKFDDYEPAWNDGPDSTEAHSMRDLRSKNSTPAPGEDPIALQYAKPLPRHVPDDFGYSRPGAGGYHDDGTYGTSHYSRSASYGGMSEFEQKFEDDTLAPTPYNPYAHPQPRYPQPEPSNEHKRIDSYMSTDTDGATKPKSLPGPPATVIPPGYAHAQLLPTKTVRLTIRVPKPFSWHAGQHVLLWIPEISRFQSHPFSILSTWDEDHETEIVLLVKARKGFTAKLFEETRKRVFASAGLAVTKEKHHSFHSMMTLGVPGAPPPVLYRVLIDGPYGSAARGRPGLHPSVLLVCGGSGISFGVSVLTYICECMASRDAGGMGRGGKGGRTFITSRVRLVWIVREFAEIAWVAKMLKRCLDMVPSEAIQIDIFVTDRKTGAPVVSTYHEGLYAEGGELLPPKPKFAQGGSAVPRTSSSGSISSMMSLDQMSDSGYDNRGAPNDEYISATDSILELTNYEDEEDEPESAAQQKLSNNLKKEGKVRRARSRRGANAESMGQQQIHQAYPPTEQRPPSQAASRSTDHTCTNQLESRTITPVPYGSAYDTPARVSLHDAESYGPSAPYNDPYQQPAAQSVHRPRPSVASSFTGSTYGRYDPFGGSGGDGRFSPSPSVTPMDFDSRSVTGESTRAFNVRSTAGSRIGSMVLVDSGAAGAEGRADAGIWLDTADYDATNVMAEMARPGRPKLDVILREEIERGRGSLGVGTCGPASLNAVVRNTVSDHISLAKIAHGDRTGIVGLFSEDYEN